MRCYTAPDIRTSVARSRISRSGCALARLALSRPRRRWDLDRSRGDTLFTVRAVRLQLYRVSTRLVPRA